MPLFTASTTARMTGRTLMTSGSPALTSKGYCSSTPSFSPQAASSSIAASASKVILSLIPAREETASKSLPMLEVSGEFMLPCIIFVTTPASSVLRREKNSGAVSGDKPFGYAFTR